MKNVLIFLAGIGIGAGTTWYFTKKHYEKIADEEINDVVERFKERMHHIEPDERRTSNDEPSTGKIVNFDRGISTNNNEELSNGIIDNPTGVDNSEEEQSEEADLKAYENESVAAYVITEEEFGDNEDYDQKTLFWYYRDNILATDEDLEVEDKFTTVGDALEEFKKDRYVERVYVRNETDETDYEILISEKHFYEVSGKDEE